MEDRVLRGYGSPYYWNAGELFVITAVAALTVCFALSLNTSVSMSLASLKIGGDDNTLIGQWIATLIILVAAFLLFIVLHMCKRRLMEWASVTPTLHTS